MRKAGFASAEARAQYERDFALHSKIHRLNRKYADKREAMICKSPALCSGSVFDWTRPFHMPWARRVRDELRNVYVPRLCVDIKLNVTRKLRYILVHRCRSCCTLLVFAESGLFVMRVCAARPLGTVSTR